MSKSKGDREKSREIQGSCFLEGGEDPAVSMDMDRPHPLELAELDAASGKPSASLSFPRPQLPSFASVMGISVEFVIKMAFPP